MKHAHLLLVCIVAAGCASAGSPNDFTGNSSKPGKGTTTSPTDPSDDGSGNGDDGTNDGTNPKPDAGKDGGKTTPDGGTTDPPDEFDVPPQCTSNSQATTGHSSSMRSGEACGASSCHGGDVAVAGTVYPTAHEPNDCKGANVAGTTIVLTNTSTNKSTSLTVNSVGNFYATGSLNGTYNVKVVSGGKERAMTTPLTSAMGDCNSCHTQNGSGNPTAPGRILLPK